MEPTRRPPATMSFPCFRLVVMMREAKYRVSVCVCVCVCVCACVLPLSSFSGRYKEKRRRQNILTTPTPAMDNTTDTYAASRSWIWCHNNNNIITLRRWNKTFLYRDLSMLPTRTHTLSSLLYVPRPSLSPRKKEYNKSIHKYGTSLFLSSHTTTPNILNTHIFIKQTYHDKI